MGFLSSIGSFFTDPIAGLVGSAVGAVGDAVGGILGGKSSEKNAQTNADAALQAAKLNTEYQKEFAQQGVRWRVEDAREAGIHPLAALGAQTPTYSPSFSMDAFNGNQQSSVSPLAIGLKSMGQNISRAHQAKMLEHDRALENAWKSAQIKRLEADTVLTQAQAAKMVVDSQQLPPAFPPLGVNIHGQVVDGQPDSGLASINNLVKVSPSQSEANIPSSPGVAAATVPDIAFTRTNDGGYALTRSDSLANRMDDDFVGNVLWHFRNSLAQLWEAERVRPPKEYLPKGASRFYFDILRGAWYPKFDKRIERKKNFISRSGSKY